MTYYNYFDCALLQKIPLQDKDFQHLPRDLIKIRLQEILSDHLPNLEVQVMLSTLSELLVFLL